MEDKEQQQAVLFLNLVMWFQAMAMQQMGKLKNPMTDKIERDMEQARLTIDMLDMLDAKTKGNLGEEEKKFFTHILSELKLNFVDEVNKDKQAAARETEKESTPEPVKSEEPVKDAAEETRKSDESTDNTTPA